MSAFYPSTYEPHAAPSTHLSWLPRWLVQYGLWKRCRPLLMWRSPGKILDVGCGTGHFLAAMQKYGTWEVVGIDLNPEAVAFARSVLKIEAYTGKIEDIGLPPHIFDAVTMWDTLEHLRDPRSALLGVWRVLKPDGRLLLRVPSLDSLDACLFGRYWAGLDAPRHLVVFSQKTLKRLLEETGFMVERLWCLSGGQASFILSLRLRFGRRDQAGWLRSVLLKIATHPLVLILSMPYFFIMDRLLLGPEITVLAKKQAR